MLKLPMWAWKIWWKIKPLTKAEEALMQRIAGGEKIYSGSDMTEEEKTAMIGLIKRGMVRWTLPVED